MALRGCVMLTFVFAFVWYRRDWQSLRIVNLRTQVVRGVLVVASTFAFITGLSLLPLADAIAVAFAGPLFLTILAVWMLDEQVAWQRWLGVLMGFAGVLIMLRPGSGGFNWPVLLPLAAGFLGALRDVVTRRMTATESTLATLSATTVFVVLGGLCTLPFGWRALSWQDSGLLLAGGLLIGMAHFLLIETFRWAEASLVAPFKYSSYLWAVLLGFFIWGQVPGFWVMLGAVLVIASGLYILRHETTR